MPTIQFHCPSCNEHYRAYVDDNTYITCYCGKVLKPNVRGKVEIVDAKPSKPIEVKSPIQTFNANSQVSNSPPTGYQNNHNNQGLWLETLKIFAVFAAAMCVIVYFSHSHGVKQPETQSPTTYTPTTSIPPSQTATSSTSVVSKPVVPNTSSSDPNNHLAIVYIRIVNTFMGTDKTMKCSAVIDEPTKTLTLKALDQPGVGYRLISLDSGQMDVQFYNNNVMEVEKEFARRPTLETGNGTLYYISETGEITLSLSYQ